MLSVSSFYVTTDNPVPAVVMNAYDISFAAFHS